MIEIRYNPVFRKNVKQLRKRYRSVAIDVKDFEVLLESGELPGDRIPGVGYTAYKARLRNRDVQKGSSGGSFDNIADNLRAAERSWDLPGFESDNYGFRCARS